MPFLIIEVPLRLAGRRVMWFEKTLMTGLNWIRSNKKAYAILFTIITLPVFYVSLLLGIASIPSEITLGALTNVTGIITTLVISLFILLFIANKNAESKWETTEDFNQVREESGKGAYNAVRTINKKKSSKENEKLLPKDVRHVVHEILATFHLASSKSAGDVAQTAQAGYKKGKKVHKQGKKAYGKMKKGKGAAKKGGSTAGRAALGASAGTAAGGGAAGAVATGGAVALVILFFLIWFLVIFFVVQFAVVMLIAGGIFYTFFSWIGAPLMNFIGGAIGLGQDWALLADQTIVEQYAPDIDLSPQVMAVQSAVAQAGCLMQPECFREWQANNTRRPGSDEVGQEFQLNIDQFEVNQGQGEFNIAFTPRDFQLPFRFRLSNTRHNLLGITAENVHYRVSVVSNEQGLDNPHCTTGWHELGDIEPGRAGDLAQAAEGEDSPVRQNINLENCEILQPALGIHRDIVLEVNYDYFSQSTIEVQAMESENVGEIIDPHIKESETADTPVQSYINVQEPIEFRENDDGTRDPIPFRVDFGIYTDEDVRYQIPDPESILVRGSTQTDIIDDQTCDLERTNRENVYQLSEERLELLRTAQEEGGAWFHRHDNPPPFSCRMEIEQEHVDTISRSGQTLSMGIEANYSIITDEASQGFEVHNDECPDFECPTLITEQQKEELDAAVDQPGTSASDYGYSNWESYMDDKYMTTCDRTIRIDARDGCGVRSEPEEWELISGPMKQEGFDTIEDGETAYSWPHPDLEDRVDEAEHEYIASDLTPPEQERDRYAFGLHESEMNELMNVNQQDYPGVALVQTEDHQGNDQVQMEEINAIFCENSPSEDFRQVWEEEHSLNIHETLYFEPLTRECEEEEYRELIELQEDYGMSGIETDYQLDDVIDQAEDEEEEEPFEEAAGTCQENHHGVVALEEHLGIRCYRR